jgi:hypothetical protein
MPQSLALNMEAACSRETFVSTQDHKSKINILVAVRRVYKKYLQFSCQISDSVNMTVFWDTAPCSHVEVD